ncbi:GNAT family N-acetyltransferase [Actinoplanes sp. TBRC 11911]|uniref:GNAT family N-acetyltransferase n=1 Tax=Actinoplanes sp. TBRC 11911 TaxID=2729386 RepID=UPI00145C6280|nr:GNAT family N-acetyltransferase [Actinoplanes sp. TBRC 11911]NMO50119.1 GNAT family N-acetyltransferase [Actinoplanes sp. TBRC 11911]
MTDVTGRGGHTIESPGDAEYPDWAGTVTQDRAVLIDEVLDDRRAPAFEFDLVNDEKAGIYVAIVEDAEVGGLTYNVAGQDRLELLATSVFPEFRRRGIATELIRRVLDDVRARGKTVTNMCPIVRAFIGRNPGYADLLDPTNPGATKGSHR